MPRIAYACPSGHYIRIDPSIGGNPEHAKFCPKCAEKIGYHGGAYINSQEKVVVMRGPDGVRFVQSADSPMAKRYAQDGFVAEHLDSHSDIRKLERETGTLHERSHYDLNSAAADKSYFGEQRETKAPIGVMGLDGKIKILRPRN